MTQPKSQLDLFYTKTTELVESLPQDFDLWLEPSAGAGNPSIGKGEIVLACLS